MVTVHIILRYYINICIGICIHIYGKHGAVIPGKEGLEFHVIVWNLTRQLSGQIQTVDLYKRFNHNCKFNENI